MTATYLPREGGVVIRCDGFVKGCPEPCDHDPGDHVFACPNNASIVTAAIYKATNRSYAATQGWGRGGVLATQTIVGSKKHDLCPSCLKLDQERAAAIKAHKDALAELKRANRAKRMAVEPGKAA